ncbi:MAG: response regulator, partial [Candidatus Brocadiaceae bacterium]|nr:response regulator [Candidatus Brocadiaceae bacterium]
MMQKRNNILVIDDDKLMRVSLKSLLEENGYLVYAVSNGEEAVQTLDKNSVDLILFDLRLYDDRELSLVNKIKEASPNTLVLIMIDQ